MKRLAPGIALLFVSFGLYAALAYYRDKPPEIKYLTSPVEKNAIRWQISATGAIKPLVEVEVGSQLSGTIKELYADFESTVQQGQLIALIDPDTSEESERSTFLRVFRGPTCHL